MKNIKQHTAFFVSLFLTWIDIFIFAKTSNPFCLFFFATSAIGVIIIYLFKEQS